MAYTGSQYFTPNPFEITSTGQPLAAGRLFFYATGTNTPQNVYADPNLTTSLGSQITADANGRFGSIWLIPTNAYKVQLWTAATVDNPTGSQIWSIDPVGPAAGGVPTSTAGIIGEVRAFAGYSSQIPAGWYECYGQAVSRTTYAQAFYQIGTQWGAGDGSTTFNLPDLRGSALFGADNMGGSPANRLTAGGSGVPGNTVGGTGGSQYTQNHNHGINDPGHNHALTDPTHYHAFETQDRGSSNPDGIPNSDAGAAGPNGATASASTGITIASAVTGVTANPYGSGNSQNVPPAAVIYWIIYLGL
jgi:microcystin-dependent protein